MLNMREQLEALQASAVEAIGQAGDLKTLEEARVHYLGRKGQLTDILRGLAQVDPADRPAMGQAANAVKDAITAALDEKKVQLEALHLQQQSALEKVDLSLPGRRARKGRIHPLNQVVEEMLAIFKELGFQVATGPDIETEYYNFDSLNTPEDHPARDSHDTFFVKPGVVLRTHTSPVQMRVMEKFEPPVAIVAPGRVYRVDFDASHSPMFYQMEGLLVDEGVTFADLKGTLMFFLQRFFGKETKVRFRPHFFPFTEPSAEIDISCTVCKGAGCRLCKNSGWLEVAGCGMVHPEVFRYAKYDYEKYSGYAFGFGVDRMTLLRHSISTIHHLYENDMRFLEQF
jgi:phenylalanyl-tRNA synthetase alpha chain